MKQITSHLVIKQFPWTWAHHRKVTTRSRVWRIWQGSKVRSGNSPVPPSSPLRRGSGSTSPDSGGRDTLVILLLMISLSGIVQVITIRVLNFQPAHMLAAQPVASIFHKVVPKIPTKIDCQKSLPQLTKQVLKSNETRNNTTISQFARSAVQRTSSPVWPPHTVSLTSSSVIWTWTARTPPTRVASVERVISSTVTAGWGPLWGWPAGRGWVGLLTSREQDLVSITLGGMRMVSCFFASDT